MNDLCERVSAQTNPAYTQSGLTTFDVFNDYY